MYILTHVFYLSKELLQSVYMNVDCLHHCASSCNHALYKKEGESLHGSTILFSIVLTVWNISTPVNKLVFTLFQGWTEEMESGNFFQTGLCFAALFSKFTWWWTGKKKLVVLLLLCCCISFWSYFFSHVLHNHTKTANLTNYSEKLFSSLRDRQIAEERQRERERGSNSATCTNIKFHKSLTLYTLTPVCIISILLSLNFLRCWQGEFV